MISVEKARRIFDEAQSKSEEDLQVLLSGGKNQLARIGKNRVYQNMMEKDYSLKVQVSMGKRVGNTSCNRFFGEELDQAVKQAESIATHQKEDPDFSGFYKSDEEVVDQRFYCHETMGACFSEKLTELEAIFEDAKSKDVEVAGAFSHGDEITALGNSDGLFRYHVCTDSSFTFSVMTPKGGTGWAEFHSNSLSEIQPSKLYDISLQKALLSENPKEVDEGEFTVILEPPAVESLLLFLGYMGLGGMPCREGRSYFSGKLGEELLGKNITLIDDAANEHTFGCPYDYEGVRRQKLTLIKEGRFESPALDRVTADKLGLGESTGHALPYPSRTGPLPLNMTLQGGESSVEEMIKGTKRGILVTRFFYDNVIDPGKLTMTGMTRDGTFLIENGTLTTGLKNLRYNDSLIRIFNNIVALSKEQWSLRSFGRMNVPAIKVEGFRFTGVGS
jgi:PmbA protein